MALKTDIRGMIWRYPDYFVVGREQLRQFALAVKDRHPAHYSEDAAAELGHDAILAPLTYATIFAKLVQLDFFRHVDIGMETLVIVQVDQRFVFSRPIKAGDKLWARMDIHSVDERFGADIVVTRNTCTDDEGRVVLQSYTTLMSQYAESENLKWDPESGQVVRTA
ncbi:MULTISPECIES: (3R)-hydroxyacyl-ACP dehydratase subunit HadC [unclassified Mycobacterium]|uniref:(3R)-hydroxyacyl-ACP dehydratase subunit HadC n=1 Tax=unclassified Mycobacterium TaxID=2642494 RepID=UPI0007FC4211|nr:MULTISPECIES: (3R)-hydroxyacyl-ACP dehydratase subunit HadC [unclassified Mycobacterium]OBG56444.1 3-hydroxyacyl-ACP dehydratase [Mycobacterium sp. E188]OBG65937.1 3-hydroxyacyl-ACP dehydratase [Mycobacterium sp. E735]OBG90272.1 3-hydroxyacyl-ACP dehydratase [Mycobacterium sp. E3298]OBH37989.1 3-hydroxyacyl-ACP dehydratase [Mycobacterium sp. E183]